MATGLLWLAARVCGMLFHRSKRHSLGISLAVGRLTLDQLGQVRILDPQPLTYELLPSTQFGFSPLGTVPMHNESWLFGTLHT